MKNQATEKAIQNQFLIREFIFVHDQCLLKKGRRKPGGKLLEGDEKALNHVLVTSEIRMDTRRSNT